MIGKTIQERTLSYLEQLTTDVFRAIEKGNIYAIGQFEKDGEKISSSRLFDTMRYKARLDLEAKGYSLKDLSMDGLHISYKGYEIKVLKAQKDGQPPLCGKSRNRWRFFNHKKHPSLFDDFAATIKEFGLEERRELLMLYRVSGDGNFLGLELTCTNNFEQLYAPMPLDWRIATPDPATIQAPLDKYDEPSKDVTIFDDQEDDRDLDIFKDGTND